MHGDGAVAGQGLPYEIVQMENLRVMAQEEQYILSIIKLDLQPIT